MPKSSPQLPPTTALAGTALDKDPTQRLHPANSDDVDIADIDLAAPKAEMASVIRHTLRTEGKDTHISDTKLTLIVPTLVPAQIAAIRTRLGLNARQLGTALGYGGKEAAARVVAYESGAEPIPAQISLLMRYIDTHGLLTVRRGGYQQSGSQFGPQPNFPNAGAGADGDTVEQLEREILAAVKQVTSRFKRR
jgi:DNA-binding transcriptional regulator YiaG